MKERRRRRRRRRIGLVSGIVKWKVENVVLVFVFLSFGDGRWWWWVWVCCWAAGMAGCFVSGGFRQSRGRREWRNLERWRSHSVIFCLKTEVSSAIHDNI